MLDFHVVHFRDSAQLSENPFKEGNIIAYLEYFVSVLKSELRIKELITFVLALLQGLTENISFQS